jgi:hypothetical protein
MCVSMRVCLGARGTATSNHDYHAFVTKSSLRLTVVAVIGTNLFGERTTLFGVHMHLFDERQRVERKLWSYVARQSNLSWSMFRIQVRLVAMRNVQ